MDKLTANRRAKRKFFSIITEEEKQHWIKHKYIWVKRVDTIYGSTPLQHWMLLRNGGGKFLCPFFFNVNEVREYIEMGYARLRIFDACIIWRQAGRLPPYDRHALMYLYFKSQATFWGPRANARVHFDVTPLPADTKRAGAYSIRGGRTTIPEFPAEVLATMDTAKTAYDVKRKVYEQSLEGRTPPTRLSLRVTAVGNSNMQVNSPVTSSSATMVTTQYFADAPSLLETIAVDVADGKNIIDK